MASIVQFDDQQWLQRQWLTQKEVNVATGEAIIVLFPLGGIVDQPNDVPQAHL
jgi:hypothetical protein